MCSARKRCHGNIFSLLYNNISANVLLPEESRALRDCFLRAQLSGLGLVAEAASYPYQACTAVEKAEAKGVTESDRTQRLQCSWDPLGRITRFKATTTASLRRIQEGAGLVCPLHSTGSREAWEGSESLSAPDWHLLPASFAG